jgi:tetratricopeptide (TPR) repeat protein
MTRLTGGSERFGALTSPFSRLAKLRRVLRRGEYALRNGDLDAAERAGRRVLDQLGTDSDDLTNLRPGELGAMISGLELLACVRREFTDFVGCVELHQRALTALELGPRGAHRDQLRLAALVRLGEVLRLLGQFPEAEDALKRAVQLADTHHPPDPINRAMALNGLGIVFKDTQRFEQAARHYQQALTLPLAIWQGRYGPQHYEVAVVKHNLAALYQARGDQLRALRTLTQVIDIKSHILGPTHAEVV